MEVILKFARPNAWAGITKYKNCKEYIGPYWTRSGNRYTGLTEEDARRLEKAIGYEEGHLAPTSPYWVTFSVQLGAKPVILHTENPFDELRYLFLKNHKRVANGIANTRPTHVYVLVNQDDVDARTVEISRNFLNRKKTIRLVNQEYEAEESNRINKKKREAFTEFGKMSIEEMRKCLRLYGKKSDNISNELVESKLFELIEADPDKYFLLWVNNKNKDTQYIIEAAISKNVMRKSKNVYYYGTDVIGRSLEDAIATLKEPKNQDIRMAILQEIESK